MPALAARAPLGETKLATGIAELVIFLMMLRIAESRPPGVCPLNIIIGGRPNGLINGQLHDMAAHSICGSARQGESHKNKRQNDVEYPSQSGHCVEFLYHNEIVVLPQMLSN